MKINHSIKFQMNETYEMYSISLEMDTSELAKEKQALPLSQQAMLVQKSLIKQACLFQVAKGYRTMESVGVEMQRLEELCK